MDIAEGIKALVLGMTTTFLILILISIIISLFKYLNPTNKEKKEISQPKVEPTAIVAENDKKDDLEIIAVITAAIAASLNTGIDTLRVTSFRKLKTNSRWK